MTIKNRWNWCFDIDDKKELRIFNKQELINQYIVYMLIRTNQMFEYTNLPDTCPKEEIEKLHQVKGYCVWIEHNKKLYALRGELGGVGDVWDYPTQATVVNPALNNLSKTYKIDSDCVVSYNDTFGYGLLPLIEKYAKLLAESDISMALSSVNIRIPNFITADSDNDLASANRFLKDVVDGNIGAVLESSFLDGINSKQYDNTNGSKLKDLIEFQQYTKGSMFIELGLNASFNMKRESLNESEIGQDEDTLLPLLDNMLETRKKDMKKVSEFYSELLGGKEIEVNFSSAWKKVRKEINNYLNQSQEVKENNNVVNEETTESEELKEDE